MKENGFLKPIGNDYLYKRHQTEKKNIVGNSNVLNHLEFWLQAASNDLLMSAIVHISFFLFLPRWSFPFFFFLVNPSNFGWFLNMKDRLPLMISPPPPRSSHLCSSYWPDYFWVVPPPILYFAWWTILLVFHIVIIVSNQRFCKTYYACSFKHFSCWLLFFRVFSRFNGLSTWVVSKRWNCSGF